jgi:hypothetical protein
MNSPEFEPYEIELRGGPWDGRILPGVGDPLSPAQSIHCSDDGQPVAIYSPRPGAGDSGPLWVYVFIGYELGT